MTLLAVSLAPESPDEIDAMLELARRSVAEGAELIEWRIDRVADAADAAALVSRLVGGVPVPCIVTCRPIWEGGDYDGDDAARVSLLEAIGTSAPPPSYFDVELALWSRSANLRQKIELVVAHRGQHRPVSTRLVLSSHDFGGRPSDLLRRLAAMADEPTCAVAKIAWRARSLRDNLEAFELLRARTKPTIALCIGPFGLPSRVLARKFGAFLTFASAEGAAPTAPGQPTVRELRRRYRWDAIGVRTRLYGVIGWPVAQSQGPELHNAGFERVGHDGVYLPLPVPPEWEHFTATVGAFVDDPRLDFRGASVTIPHKEHLVRFVRERGGRVDPAAEAIGAANTLTVDERGEIACFNDDADAAWRTLIEEGGLDEHAAHTLSVAIIGAGGAARAVAWACAARGAHVVIFNRNASRAEALAAELTMRLRAGERARTGDVSAGCWEALARGCFPVLVNCTPVGMAGGPEPDASPLPAEFPLEPGLVLFDTVAVPQRTPLIRAALAAGAVAIGGRGMFLRQAAAQFRRWTGQPAPEGWGEALGTVSAEGAQ
ncbi:MAG TPA: type I 3-dehydroquinate dehydratase [Phycisphaerales bacterium]|nr:type I 3-dehydroquinate dehydratase [Phycisphaerales bacterium]HMP38574.1 type I 3-dehydroquinate dehydratase [Phycisphaerales bacterium]